MSNYQKHSPLLPRPYPSNEKKSRDCPVRRNSVSLPCLESAKGEDFPTQSSLHFTRFRVALLVVVLVGITIGLLLSGFFLFSGKAPLPPLDTLVMPSSLPIIGLVGAAGGVGIVLWITLSFLLKRSHMIHAQKAWAPHTLVSAEWAIPLPEPHRRSEL